MNLIERIGSYEKAKMYLTNAGEVESIIFPSSNDYVQTTKADLEYSLLQYRRENNIFEVGDSVVLISGYTDKVHYLSGWYIEGFDFRYKTNPSGWGVIVKSSMPNVWRHATDEEIKEGHRL